MISASGGVPVRIGIIGGAGKMGRALADFWSGRGLFVTSIDRGHSLQELEEFCVSSTHLVLCVPQEVLPGLLSELKPFLEPRHSLLDITSRKVFASGLLLELAEELGCSVLPTHPVFGPSNVVPGETVVLCPLEGHSPKELLDFAQEELFAGMKCLEMTPSEHDNSMHYVQSLQHFLEILYSEFLRQESTNFDKLLSVSTPVYSLQMLLIGRILGHDPELYSYLVYGDETEREVVRSLLSRFANLAKKMSEESREEYEERFQLSREFFTESFCRKAQNQTDDLISRLLDQNNTSTNFDK